LFLVNEKFGIKSLTDTSIQHVDIFLQQQNPAHIDSLADYLIGKLDSLASIVGNHPILLQDELSGDFLQYQVKTFSSARLLGTFILTNDNFSGEGQELRIYRAVRSV